MPKLLQINVVNNVLSTGKIVEDIAKVAVSNGWESFVAYGRYSKTSISREIRIGSMFDVYEHYMEHRLFDNEGRASRCATRKLIKQISEIKPDIIQLHNIHDHYLNYPILFTYLATLNTPVVWVQHDCWAFTGGCMYFDVLGCDKWEKQCCKCPEKRSFWGDNSEQHFLLKKRLLSQIKKLVFVPVSNWLSNLMRRSVQKDREIYTIHNGIDINLFKPICSKVSDGKFRILGVAAVWSSRKGLDDFIRLRLLLSTDFEIILVGLTDEQIKELPTGIKGLHRTSSIEELVELYSKADVFVNPTYSDNFPTTNLEALACGTPVITYETGGSPEAIDEKTGVVIPQGNIMLLAETLYSMRKVPYSPIDCRRRAEQFFDKDKCFQQYINLYKKLITK